MNPCHVYPCDASEKYDLVSLNFFYALCFLLNATDLLDAAASIHPSFCASSVMFDYVLWSDSIDYLMT